MKKNTLLWIILTVIIIFGAAAAAVLLARSGAWEKPTEPTLPVETEKASESGTESEAEDPQITVALSEYRVLLNWTAVEGADGYYITYDDGSGPVDYGKTSHTTFRKKGLKGGTAYTFYVTPYCLADGEEIAVDGGYTVSGHTLPDIPVYTAVRDGDTCRLSWKEVNNAAEYRIFSSADGENWTQEGSTSGSEYAFSIGDQEKKLFTAVKAVIKTDAGEIVSDYTKMLVADGAKKKKLCSYGDSVAVGIGSHNYSYADIFAEEYGLELIDRSNAGSELSSNNPKKHHIAESILKDVTPDYDYVFIEGGNNDHYFNSPLGELSPEGTTEFDMKTTVGALEAAFTYLRDTCPDTKVVFIMVHKRAPMNNDLGMSFEEYAEAIEAVCERYGVPVADCLNDSGFDTADAQLCNEYTHHFNGVFPTGDGVHPTEEAYRKFYLPLIEAALNQAE